MRSVREVAAYVHRAWQAVFHARYAVQRLEKAGRGEEDANVEAAKENVLARACVAEVAQAGRLPASRDWCDPRILSSL